MPSAVTSPEKGLLSGAEPTYREQVLQEITFTVGAPADVVWEVMTDVQAWPEWTASVTTVERLDEGPLRVGSRARIVQPKIPTVVWEVGELVEGVVYVDLRQCPGQDHRHPLRAGVRIGPLPGPTLGRSGGAHRVGRRSSVSAPHRPLPRHGSSGAHRSSRIPLTVMGVE